MPRRLPTGYDAVVLAGGQARRLGGADKAGLEIGGITLLDRAVLACAGALRVVVVGPHRRTGADREVRWVRESPPGGGPVAALAAGLPLTSAETVVLLGVDTPFVTAELVDRLVRTVPVAGRIDGAILVGSGGRDQPLIGAYRRSALAARLSGLAEPAGVALRDVIGALDLVRLPDQDGASMDCDTPQQLERARARAEGGPADEPAR